MKSLCLGIALACCPGLVVGAQVPPTPAHDDHAALSTAPMPAQRYATDAPLREGMRRVRAALDELRHYEMGHMPEQIALERVGDIEEATRYMFANCKLAAAPDAALHGMLVPLLAAAAALKKNPQDLPAVGAMRNAVADYPRYFDDPAPTATGNDG